MTIESCFKNYIFTQFSSCLIAKEEEKYFPGYFWYNLWKDSHAKARPKQTANQENEGVEEATCRKDSRRPGEKIKEN
jgi:hypothetical protein